MVNQCSLIKFNICGVSVIDKHNIITNQAVLGSKFINASTGISFQGG